MIECVVSHVHRNRPDVRRVLAAVQAGARDAGQRAELVAHSNGQSRIVVVWGAGHPEVKATIDDVIARGAHVVAWDLGYWQRGTHFRCSIDAAHPQSVVMRKRWPHERWARLGIAVRDEWNPEGPIILAGMGWKSARMYGEPVGQWERETAVAIRERFPGLDVHFRPKETSATNRREVSGCVTRGGNINAVLHGASLVVCRHSNVAIDAIIAGIPVVAMGGAASAVCPTRLEDVGGPLPDDVRLRFLHNLAWFNWSLDEMREASTWAVIEGMTSD